MEETFLINLLKMVQELATGQKDDYTTVCLLDDPYFKENYILEEIYLNKL